MPWPPVTQQDVTDRIDANYAALLQRMNELTADSGWVRPTFQNGWTQYGDTNFGVVAYRKVAGRVQLRGLMAGGTLGAVAFNLPTGFRPGHHLIFPTVAVGAMVEVRLHSDGNLVPHGGGNAWYALNVITYIAEW